MEKIVQHLDKKDRLVILRNLIGNFLFAIHRTLTREVFGDVAFKRSSQNLLNVCEPSYELSNFSYGRFYAANSGFDCRNGLPVVESTYDQIYRSFESRVSKISLVSLKVTSHTADPPHNRYCQTENPTFSP